MSTLVNIGYFSRMTLLSVKALRHYHDLGLLAPAHIDRETGYRQYSIEQVPIAQAIRRLRELGMRLDGIRVVIEAADVRTRNETISAHLRRMEAELEKTRSTVKSLRMLLDRPTPNVVDVAYWTAQPTQALAVRERLTSADVFDWMGAAYPRLRSAVHETAATRSGPDAALYSAELLEDEFGDITALIPVHAGARGVAGVEVLDLPRVEYAVATHVGSLDDIDQTYAALGAVVAERAIAVQGPIREDYLVGALDTPDESAHRTEILWPIFQTTITS